MSKFERLADFLSKYGRLIRIFVNIALVLLVLDKWVIPGDYLKGTGDLVVSLSIGTVLSFSIAAEILVWLFKEGGRLRSDGIAAFYAPWLPALVAVGLVLLALAPYLVLFFLRSPNQSLDCCHLAHDTLLATATTAP